VKMWVEATDGNSGVGQGEDPEEGGGRGGGGGVGGNGQGLHSLFFKLSGQEAARKAPELFL